MSKQFKPMLLSNDPVDLGALDYTNMYISIKRDGVRAQITNKGIIGRSLKHFKNPRLNEYFKDFYEQLPAGAMIEAEIYSIGTPCRNMAGICNSGSRELPVDVALYVFGVVDLELTFKERMILLETLKPIPFRVFIVPQFEVDSESAVMGFYDDALREGYEGAVLMDGRKPYKCGRVTIKQHIGYKLKPGREDDLEIVGVTERMENTNESLTNELGRSYKRNTVANKKPTGIAAAFVCKLDNGETCKVTIKGEESFRREIWENKESYVGKYAVVESMDYGVKDKLRHPRMINIKEACEK